MIHAPDKYGYTTDITHPRIRRWYEAYRRKLGLPHGIPLSDEQRWYFDTCVSDLIRQEWEEQRGRWKRENGNPPAV